MIRATMIAAVLCFALAPLSAAGAQFEADTFPTSAGDLKITFIGHGTLMFEWGGKVIHVDPVSEYADYSQLPKPTSSSSLMSTVTTWILKPCRPFGRKERP